MQKMYQKADCQSISGTCLLILVTHMCENTHIALGAFTQAWAWGARTAPTPEKHAPERRQLGAN